ncbi:MAG: hypothetical protein AB7F89_17380 [Pirellulaceae bacterium]
MRLKLAGLAVCSVLLTHIVAAETVVENGVTYRVTRRVEKTPVANLHLEEHTQTVYRTESVTQFREQQRTVWVPVTEYQYQPRWTSPWNLFAASTPSYELRPVTRWEMRSEKILVPVTTQRVVPEQAVVQVPVRKLGFVDREIVEKIAVNTSAGQSLTTVASSSQILAPAQIADRSQRPRVTDLIPLRR